MNQIRDSANQLTAAMRSMSAAAADFSRATGPRAASAKPLPPLDPPRRVAPQPPSRPDQPKIQDLKQTIPAASPKSCPCVVQPCCVTPPKAK